jgi:hypothetical protein
MGQDTQILPGFYPADGLLLGPLPEWKQTDPAKESIKVLPYSRRSEARKTSLLRVIFLRTQTFFWGVQDFFMDIALYG